MKAGRRRTVLRPPTEKTTEKKPKIVNLGAAIKARTSSQYFTVEPMAVRARRNLINTREVSSLRTLLTGVKARPGTTSQLNLILIREKTLGRTSVSRPVSLASQAATTLTTILHWGANRPAVTTRTSVSGTETDIRKRILVRPFRTCLLDPPPTGEGFSQTGEVVMDTISKIDTAGEVEEVEVVEEVEMVEVEVIRDIMSRDQTLVIRRGGGSRVEQQDRPGRRGRSVGLNIGR